uniref:Uncharacterized protein n=1 Tax=Avena sativa TaxID=4498 RepID=A0ACD5XXM2_AVESA
MASPPPIPATPAPSSQRKRGRRESVGLFAIQCCDCQKWRTVPTKDEFETIRENLTEDPWFCSKRPNCSCEDPADIEYDNSRIWVIDRPNIPKPPPETERLAIIRRDLTAMDICYVLPNGQRAKSMADVQKFLDANPEYKDSLSVESFNFTLPKVVEETVSGGSAWRTNKQAKNQGKINASSSKK